MKFKQSNTFLSVVCLLFLFLCFQQASAQSTTTIPSADDFGDDCAVSSPLALDTAIGGEINSPGDYDYFLLSVPATGTLTIYTTGDTDTYGTLNDSGCNVIVFDDNSNDGSNFFITRKILAGTYFVAVRHADPNATGAYSLRANYNNSGMPANILLMLDNSGSMNFPAYPDPYNADLDGISDGTVLANATYTGMGCQVSVHVTNGSDDAEERLSDRKIYYCGMNMINSEDLDLVTDELQIYAGLMPQLQIARRPSDPASGSADRMVPVLRVPSVAGFQVAAAAAGQTMNDAGMLPAAGNSSRAAFRQDKQAGLELAPQRYVSAQNEPGIMMLAALTTSIRTTSIKTTSSTSIPVTSTSIPTTSTSINYCSSKADQVVGIRFQNIQIPKSVDGMPVVITSARIVFTAAANSGDSMTDPATLYVAGQAADNPATFNAGTSTSPTIGNISGRAETTAKVTWADVGQWTTDSKANATTPDLKEIVQEIIDRPNWQAGNAMVFKITGEPGSRRRAHSYNSSPSKSPVLVIEYEPCMPKKYYGYFNPDGRYSYSSNVFRRDDAAGAWSGNFLNWLTMRRVDVIRKVLMGGKRPCENCNGIATLQGDNPAQSNRYWQTYYYAAGDYPRPTPYEEAWYGVKDGRLYVKTTTAGYTSTGNDPWTSPTASFVIEVEKDQILEPETFCDDGNPCGIIQKIGDSARWGTIWFGSTSEGGRVASAIGGGVQDIVNDIQSTGMSTSTPLAETLYTAAKYFAQSCTLPSGYTQNCSQWGIGTTSDPFYNGQSIIPNAKSFVLMLTDGVSTNDLNIPTAIKNFDGDTNETTRTYGGYGSDYLDDVALYAHVNDLRIDLECQQSLEIYTAYVFGKDPMVKIQLQETAINGGFTDRNRNNRPDGYLNDGNFVALPAEERREWDADGNGIPDNFIDATDGWQLETSLLAAVNKMVDSFEDNCTDGIDNDEDGLTDCADTDCQNMDNDNDGYTVCTGDCDENNASVHPNASEVCDTIDNNCNGQIDELPCSTADFSYAVSGGAITITHYTGPGGNVVIPSTINGIPVVAIGYSAFSHKTSITGITIPDTITHIMDFAFEGCTSLTSLIIPSSITSIGDFSFAYCTSLEAAYFYGNAPTMGSFVFYNCADAFTVYYLSGAAGFTNPWHGYSTAVFDPTPPATTTTTITAQSGDFRYIDFGDTITINAYTGMGADVVIPEAINGKPVATIGYTAFRNYTVLTCLTIPASVTSINLNTFAGCTGLTRIEVDADNPNYSSLDGVLYNKPMTTILLYPAGRAGEFIIPGTVTGFISSAFSCAVGLTSLSIPSNTTYFGSSFLTNPFSGCSSLTSIQVDANNPLYTSEGGVLYTKNKRGVVCFPAGRSGIYTVPAYVSFFTSNFVFAGCMGLTSIDVEADNPKFSSHDGVLYNKDKTRLEVYPAGRYGRFDVPDGVTSFGGNPFSGCTGLTSLTIPASVTSMYSWIFSVCTGLTSIEVDAGNPNYSSLDGVLYDKAFTKLVQYPPGKTGGLYLPASFTSFGYNALYGCTGLTSIEVDAGNPNYSSLDGVLYDKAFTKLVRYPSNKPGGFIIPGSVINIQWDAFEGCTGLCSLIIPSNLLSFGSSHIYYCSNLTSIEVDAGNPNFSSLDGVLYNKAKTELIAYPPGRTEEFSIPAGITTIGNHAFWGCTSLTTMTIPGNVKYIEGSFIKCTGLASVSIAPSVTLIGYDSFMDCSGLISVNIPGSITSIWDQTFYGCSALPSITIPASVTNIGASAFQGCSGLIGITISNGITSIGNQAFASCSGLRLFIFPGTVTSIGDYAFSLCSGLSSAYLPTSVMTIGAGVYQMCTNLISIDVNAENLHYSSHDGILYDTDRKKLVQYPPGRSGGCSIPSGVTSVESYAFRGSRDLTLVTIPDTVANIGVGAFQHCSGLASVILPGSVTNIGSAAFSYCTASTGAYFYGNAPTMGTSVFYENASGFTVYYLASSTGFTNPWYDYPTALFTQPGDADSDSIDDAVDNCPEAANPQQLDADADAIGDVCDTAPGCGGCGQPVCEGLTDIDGDYYLDSIDNCPDICNFYQLDADGDGIGDVCDPEPGCGGCGQPPCETVCIF